LKENLDENDIDLEKYRVSEQLIVVSIAKGFISANNKDKSPANYLVVVLEADGTIHKAT
jgi:hypothetical protein